MGKLDTNHLRFLSDNDLRLLATIEFGMKYNEYVSILRIAHIGRVYTDGLSSALRELTSLKLLCFENKNNGGYRLTNKGFDYLALSNLVKNDHVSYFGNQIGVGKESNIYIVANSEEEELCLKLHRLGRTSFRNVKNKRDYHKYSGGNNSWLNLSRISAAREFACMNALYERKFPIPRPIAKNRHCVVMELIRGSLLDHVREVEDVQTLYSELMELIVRFGNAGLVHGDFNEFNIILTDEEKPVIIDFPQMISIMHEEAEMYFDRDVKCINTFFERRFGYISEDYPKFSDIVRDDKIDCEIMCSGVTKAKMREFGLVDNDDDDGNTDEVPSMHALSLNDKEDDFFDNIPENENEETISDNNSKEECKAVEEDEDKKSKTKKPSKLYTQRMKLFGFEGECSSSRNRELPSNDVDFGKSISDSDNNSNTRNNGDDSEEEQESTYSQATRSISAAEMKRRKQVQKQLIRQKCKSERVTALTKAKKNNNIRNKNQQVIKSSLKDDVWG